MNSSEQTPPNLAGKKLLVLDGSRKAIEIVEQAQSMGVHVIVTDYNDPEASPAKLYADEYRDVSTSDIDAVVQLIKDEQIDGVVTGFSDRWLPTYAQICEKAGLPHYATEDQLRVFTDKTAYKPLMEKHGVPTVQGYTLEQAQAGEIPLAEFPVIVKPADGSGSRGISICADQEELEQGIQVALDYSWTGDLLIERYLPGDEATVHWVFQDGDYYVAMVANRHMLTFADGAHRLPNAYTSPSYLTPKYLAEVAPRVKAMLQDAGVKNGTMFMQGLVDDGTIRTYDIGFRLTPTQEYRILEEVSGFNPLEMMITYALTGSMGEPQLASKVDPEGQAYGFNNSTLMMPSTIGSYEGVEEVSKYPQVLSMLKALAEGETLPPEGLGQLRQIVLRTIGTAETKEELESTLLAIAETLKVRNPDGALTSLPGIVSEELSGKVL